MQQINTNKKQKGFSILGVILVIVAVIVAIGVWALSGQTNTSASGNSTSDIQAASLINDGQALKTHYIELKVQTNFVGTNFLKFLPGTASVSPEINFYDTATGIAAIPINKNILRSNITIGSNGEGYWIFTDRFIMPAIGSNSNDVMFAVYGIKDSVCQRINQNLNGTNTIPFLNATAGNAISQFNSTTLSNPKTISSTPVMAGLGASLTANAAWAGWTSGCVNINASTPDYNMYFIIVEAR